MATPSSRSHAPTKRSPKRVFDVHAASRPKGDSNAFLGYIGGATTALGYYYVVMRFYHENAFELANAWDKEHGSTHKFAQRIGSCNTNAFPNGRVLHTLHAIIHTYTIAWLRPPLQHVCGLCDNLRGCEGKFFCTCHRNGVKHGTKNSIVWVKRPREPLRWP